MSFTGLLGLISVIISCDCYAGFAVCSLKLISCTWYNNRIYSDPLEIQCHWNGVIRTPSRFCGVAFSTLYRRAATAWPGLVNSSYLFPLELKYLPQHRSLESPLPVFLHKFGEPTVHSCIAKHKIIFLYILFFIFW